MDSTTIPFVRMNGIGNEIVIADSRGGAGRVTPEAARMLAGADGMGFDQIMEVADAGGPDRDYDVTILNSDGSAAQACGNGTRCVASWLKGQDGRGKYRFRIGGALVTAAVRGDGTITVDMGRPKFGWGDIPLAEAFGDTRGIELQIGPIDAPILHTPSVVSMGNPHAVFWVDDVNAYDLERVGPLLENHPIFPERANITLARVAARDHIVIATWERGAGLTKACGSAACAALVCAVRKGMAERRARISLPGGDLEVEWDDNDHVLMSGPVAFEFAGRMDPATGAFERDPLAEGA
jgi:diaminopimelate epimerase